MTNANNLTPDQLRRIADILESNSDQPGFAFASAVAAMEAEDLQGTPEDGEDLAAGIAPPGPAKAIGRYGTGYYVERAFDGDWSGPFDSPKELATTLGLTSYPDNGCVVYWDANEREGYTIHGAQFLEEITDV